MFQWMPGTRRAAAESASSPWAKTRHRGSGACRPRRSTGRSSSGSSGTRRPPFSPDGPRHPGPAAPGARPAGGRPWRGSSTGPYDAHRSGALGRFNLRPGGKYRRSLAGGTGWWGSRAPAPPATTLRPGRPGQVRAFYLWVFRTGCAAPAVFLSTGRSSPGVAGTVRRSTPRPTRGSVDRTAAP